MKIALGDAGNDAGNRGFAGARRSPQDERQSDILFDQPPDRALLAEQMLVPQQIVPGFGAHAVGQWRWRGVVGSIFKFRE